MAVKISSVIDDMESYVSYIEFLRSFGDVKKYAFYLKSLIFVR